MSALGIAFDIIIVGALALSWTMLIVDLFFTKKEQKLKHIIDSAAKDISGPVLGVLLFAMAYFLGTAVSRTAQDSLNDDDLWRYVHIPLWHTEDDIRTNTYCRSSEKLLGLKPGDIALTAAQIDALCRSSQARKSKEGGGSLQINDIFNLQEGALLLNGDDKTLRLHQLRDQIIVLCGTAFNGFMAFWLSLFGVCTRYARTWGWIAAFGLFAAGILSLAAHWRSALAEAPLMEFTLFALACVGVFILRKNVTRDYRPVALISLLATLLAYWSWQATQVLYNDRVIYSFYALSHGLEK